MRLNSPMVLGYAPMGTGSHRPFDQVFTDAARATPEAIRAGQIDALVLWGGEDISPSIYKQRACTKTMAGNRLSHRDAMELGLLKAATEAGIPIIGVCRGAQMVCAFAGGKLVQHVTGHHQTHAITTKEKKSLMTTSVHHQMMYPFDVKHELIAWAENRLSTTYIGEDDAEITEARNHPEPEIVYFPDVKALAIQGHPEFVSDGQTHLQPFVRYCNEKVVEYLLD